MENEKYSEGTKRDELKFKLVTYMKIGEQYFISRKEAESEKEHFEAMEGLDPMNIYVVEPVDMDKHGTIIETLEIAHKLSRKKIDELVDELKKTTPGLEEEIKKNLEKYGVPFLSQSYGGLWQEDLANIVSRILNKEAKGNWVEIIIKPEDEEGHHWCCEYYVLKYENGKFVRVVGYNKKE